jgi:homocysteine S-methyltransferase
VTRDPIAPILEARGVVVLDGGLGTELEARGADLRDPLWSASVLVEDPGLVREVHEAFLDAGADVITTSSYQASFEGLAARGFDRDTAEALLRRSVELAQEARGGWWSGHDHAERAAPLVAASVGPYGALLGNGSEYTGDYDRGADELVGFHLPRIEALAAAEPDLLAIETIPSFVEAEALARALERVPEVPAWVSFSCRNAAELCDGTPFDRAVTAMAGVPNVVAVGVNCTSPLHVEGLVRVAAATAGVPVVAYPNRGAFWDAVRKAWVDPPRQDPRPSLRPAAWHEAGARLIGGCCGIGPADIRSIAEILHGERARGRPEVPPTA